MKTAKTFRLSNQAVESLRTLVEITGTNETAIIEIALAHFSQVLKGQPAGYVPEPPPDFPDCEDEPLPVIEKRGRPRHKSKH